MSKQNFIKDEEEKMSSRISGRTAFCRECGQSLDSNIDPVCEVCGWIICSCGACSPDCTGE
ncbi:MAG: hypothetical protein P9M03_05510 [Candidatus Theseobacter exili]|nr:hypothetical protein [Candidatus Theseobacter exili]